MKYKIAFLSLIACGISFSASSKLQIPNIFSDNMVIQADTVAGIWGHATPGAQVSVSTSWGETASSKADKSGKWNIGIKTPVASYNPLSLSLINVSEPTRPY